ncbi:UNVERIFIED_ORG: hypothetical protein ABIB52_001844 [Arthrobacter sp. UYCu721]
MDSEAPAPLVQESGSAGSAAVRFATDHARSELGLDS